LWITAAVDFLAVRPSLHSLSPLSPTFFYHAIQLTVVDQCSTHHR
jgi:hypothetical protein